MHRPLSHSQSHSLAGSTIRSAVCFPSQSFASKLMLTMRSKIRILFLLAIHLFAALVWPNSQASGQVALESSRADVSALATIFNEQHVIESGPSICRRAAQLPPEARLEFLRSWVIPDPSTASLRVTVDFEAGGTEANDAVRMFSPAYDLIQLAAELDQIERLRAMVVDCPPGTPKDEFDRLALLAIIAIETGDDATLNETLDKWFKRVQSEPPLLKGSTATFVLLARAAIDHSHPSPEIRELIRSATMAQQAEYNRDAWLRHLVALFAKLEKNTPQENVEDEAASPAAPTQWHLANLERAFEHGNAFPKPLWQLQRGGYRNLSNYGDMLLMFQSPLLGDFSVEATATGFGYREAHLVVGGRWTGMVHDHKHIIVGEPRGEMVRQPLAPPLNDTNNYGFIRTLVDVQDENTTTWMNGRLILQQPVLQSDSPWLGIRTNYRVRGGVDDLQIAGEPIIPERIAMVDTPQLLGWYDYYDASGNSPSQITGWEVSRVPGPTGQAHYQISHPRMTDVPTGSHVEQLLRYLRPFAEDGTIGFEFYYEPGQTAAHPAIGRTVFLLTDKGVQRHRLTDGRFDRTKLRPDNGTSVKDATQQSLPLLPKQWNRVEVNRTGERFTVVLNGQEVCQEPLTDDTTMPQFGIFHFADQSSLLVRNFTWNGQWPKQLPSVHDQELANPLDDVLAWTSDQPAQTYHHVFDETSITSGAFVSLYGESIKTVQATPGGLIVRRTSSKGYEGTMVADTLNVGGDFEVTVGFDQMDLQSQLGKVASVLFEVVADSADQDLAGMQATRDRKGGVNVQCVRIISTDGNIRRSYFSHEPAEGKGGRLSIYRRGNMIFYAAADNDSDRFRLIGKETFTTADLKFQGIRFGVQAEGPEAFASTRFTSLTVRAERIKVAAPTAPKPNIPPLPPAPNGILNSVRDLFN